MSEDLKLPDVGAARPATADAAAEETIRFTSSILRKWAADQEPLNPQLVTLNNNNFDLLVLRRKSEPQIKTLPNQIRTASDRGKKAARKGLSQSHAVLSKDHVGKWVA
jgi:hypothetical protein